jgi:hypothetical protein
LLSAKLAFGKRKTSVIIRCSNDFRVLAPFEQILNAPIFIVVGAHIANGMEACVEAFGILF